MAFFLLIPIFLAFFIFVIAAIVFTALIRGYVLTYLWSWFIIPLFPNVPQLSVLAAFGICLVVGFFTPTDYEKLTKKSEDDKTEWKAIGLSYASPFLTLLIGYIVHSFM